MAEPCRIPSGPLQLAGHVARPGRSTTSLPAVVLCHNFPADAGAALSVAATYPILADRIATELGWVALTFSFRGCGTSEGQFSLGGWLEDLVAAIEFVRGMPNVDGVWLAGFGTGGALCVCAAARDAAIRGVAALAAPADFDDWATQPRRLLQHARDIGLVKDPNFPISFDSWAHDLRALRAVECVTSVVPRPLLVVHGTDDDSVPDFDARVVADAHGHAELRIVAGAGHQLRHDPRAVAVLLGWLDRERHAVRS